MCVYIYIYIYIYIYTARADGAGYVINGQKWLITGMYLNKSIFIPIHLSIYLSI